MILIVGTVQRNFIVRKLLVAQESVLRLLGRRGTRVLFELLLLIFVLLSVGIIAASQWSAVVITGHGNLRVDGVGVYHDTNCNVALKYLDWGTVEPRSTSDISLYVRNEGNHIATLFLATDDWIPENASDYMSLSWNYDGKTLSPMESIELTLTLSVSADARNMDSFSFKVILGTNE